MEGSNGKKKFLQKPRWNCDLRHPLGLSHPQDHSSLLPSFPIDGKESNPVKGTTSRLRGRVAPASNNLWRRSVFAATITLGVSGIAGAQDPVTDWNLIAVNTVANCTAAISPGCNTGVGSERRAL